MKRILLEVFVYSFALYATSLMFSGLRVKGGLQEVVLGGILVAIGFVIIKPILNIISLPFNFITLWIFSFMTSAVIMFIVTNIYTKIQIVPFKFQGAAFLTVNIPSMNLNSFLSYVIISATIAIISKLLLWLYE